LVRAKARDYFPSLLRCDADHLVCSFGGVGTTFLMKFASQYVVVNDWANCDGLKHLPRPPRSFGRNVKVLYVFGDPINAVLSLFERGYARHHAGVMTSLTWRGNLTLTEFLDRGYDYFRFAETFAAWSAPMKRDYPLMLLRYETMWKHLEAIFDFFDLPSDKIDQFPPQHERSSNFRKLPLTMQQKLIEMYGGLQQHIANFNEIKLIDEPTR
jgi:hypothetical protein